LVLRLQNSSKGLLAIIPGQRHPQQRKRYFPFHFLPHCPGCPPFPSFHFPLFFSPIQFRPRTPLKPATDMGSPLVESISVAGFKVVRGRNWMGCIKRRKHDCCVAGCLSELVATPRNTVATLHQETPVELGCKTNKSDTRLSWFFDDNRNVIFNGYTVGNGKYPIVTNPHAGEFNITLTHLDASYAGLYICIEPGSNQRASAQLAILGEFRFLSFITT